MAGQPKNPKFEEEHIRDEKGKFADKPDSNMPVCGSVDLIYADGDHLWDGSGVVAQSVGANAGANKRWGEHEFFELRGREGARLFRDRISGLRDSNPFAAAVDVHSIEEYEHCRLFLTADGKAGFALSDGDNLVSVFSYRGKGAGHAVVEKAVEMGARRLDCYDIDGMLPNLYGRHGFRPVASVDFADEYAPDDWDYEIMGRPRILAMAVTDDPPERVAEHVDYDTAVRLARDAAETGRGA